MKYISQKDYEDKIKAGGTWRKQNEYDVFNYPFCLECVHFKMDLSMPVHGDCALMENEGACSGVSPGRV